MNNDDFENRLRCQPFRSPPAQWRKQILDAARSATPQSVSEEGFEPRAWLRALLWPSPRAWAALATVWVIILVMNRESEEKVGAIAGISPSPIQQIADARRQRNELFAELINETRSDALSQPPKTVSPGPRSEAPTSLVCG